MTFTDRSKEDDTVKSFEYLGRHDESPLSDEETQSNGFAENELIEKFHKSMFGYVIDHLEPLFLRPDEPLSSETDKTIMLNQRKMAVRVIYKSGNVYEGHMSNWVPNGEGRLFLGDGVTYKGRFKDGYPEGNGIVRWPDTSWYEGEFRKGLRHGRGMHVSSEDGRRWYGGQWTNGKRNGLGQTDCGAGELDGALNYDGKWVDGQPHGYGTGNWSDGTRYTGGWARGRPHGRGKAVWPEDDVYEGDWVDGFMDGIGTYEWTSNPRDHNRLVIRSCDKYTGQWSKSKKHGTGEFFSAETGSIMRGNWSNDVLDGPCEIVLCTGRRPGCSGLNFRRGVLYETSPLPQQPTIDRSLRTRTTGRGRGLPTRRTRRGVQLSDRSAETASRSFRGPCQPGLPVSAGNDDVRHPDGAATTDPRLVRANVPLAADKETACDLTGHVRRLAAECLKDTTAGSSCIGAAVDPELELQAAGCAIETHADRLEALYRAYGSFLADGTVAYRPLLTRLGLWQMLIDSCLHARISLADFDDLLFVNKDCAFNSAHEPFELVYFWQFVHAVCELATLVYDVRRIRRHDARSAGCGLMATAIHRLFAEHLRTDVVPQSYAAATAGLGEDGECWTNDRRTLASMYDLYRTMTVAETPLPTARQLIRLYGPRFVSADGRRPSLDSVLPAVLDAVLGSLDGHMAPVGPPRSSTAVFECSVETVVALLREACPRIVDARGALVDVDTRLVFAEWYRFALLCVRDCRRVPGPERDGPPTRGDRATSASSESSDRVTSPGAKDG